MRPTTRAVALFRVAHLGDHFVGLYRCGKLSLLLLDGASDFLCPAIQLGKVGIELGSLPSSNTQFGVKRPQFVEQDLGDR